MSDHHRPSDPRRVRELPTQRVVLENFPSEGLILDLGGGGEGVIGRLKGDRVVAIDPLPQELSEAPDGPLKIVMDATELQFLEGAFCTVTAFFTLMFIRQERHPKVFAEAHRVLRPGGRFLLWDVELEELPDEETDIASVPLEVLLPGETLRTGYGSSWPEQPQDLMYYEGLACAAGFEVVKRQQQGQTFFLELRKP